MNILISAYACTPNRGSEPGNGWHWALGNAKQGHDVYCFTTPEGKDAIEEEMNHHPEVSLHFLYVDVPAWLTWLYRFQPFVYVHYLVWQYRAAKLAITLDRSVSFDLIHHVTLASLQLGSGMWRLHKPFIFGPAGGGNFAPRTFKRYFSGAWMMEIFRKVTSNLLLAFNPDFINTIRYASLILAANNDTYRMAKEAGAKHIELFLDSALAEDFFSVSTSPRPVTHDRVLQILWVGRIFARKGLPLVLEALSLIKGKLPFHLTILGDGKQGYKMKYWLTRYGLEDVVTWHGQVPWSAVRKAYAEHDVFMLCSLRDSFGSQFLEAMASGLPVITLNHQGAGDHIPASAGIKVSVTQPQATIRALADAVLYMHHHPDQRMKFGEAGKAFAREHTWNKKISQVNERYEALLSHSRLYQHNKPIIHSVSPGINPGLTE